MIWDKLTNKKQAGDKPPGDRTTAEGSINDTLLTTLICLQCNREYGPDCKVCAQDGSLLVPKRLQIKTGDSLVGSVFVERYTIQDVLGEGGMSHVYKAHHAMMDRTVAIKILKNFESSQDRMLKRFQQEARAASSLSHPSLVTIHDFGITPNGEAYLVMDYLEGKSLDVIIQDEGPLQYERAGRLFMQVCEGLEHAHSKGIVHRDIKPSNIVLLNANTDHESVKIVDFGIAKLLPEANKETFHLTQAGQLFGSPLYMSPEQCANRKVDSRTDIYALGATMFNALTGKPPFEAATLAEVIYLHLKAEPRRLVEANKKAGSVPDVFEKVIRRCLEKVPEQRYNSMNELKTEISVACNLNKKPATKRIEMIKVVLAEDNDELAATITESIAKAGGAFVSARAVNGEEAIDKVMQTLPQILLIDFRVPMLNGAEVTKQLKATSPNLRILIFTIGDNIDDIITALGCGADGFILDDLSPTRLGPAIKAIMSGIPWIDPEISSKVLRQSLHAAGPARRDRDRDRDLDISTKPASNEKLDHAEFFETLAGVYMQEKKYDEAEALYHGAIALAEKSCGKDSNEVAAVSTKLADLYMSRKKSAAAEKLYLRALEIRFQTLGQEHVEVAASLESLALLFKLGGGHSEAERFYLWAIRIREKLTPEKDEALASTFTKLAAVYRDMGRQLDAQQMENRASNIREELLSKTALN